MVMTMRYLERMLAVTDSRQPVCFNMDATAMADAQGRVVALALAFFTLRCASQSLHSGSVARDLK